MPSTHRRNEPVRAESRLTQDTEQQLRAMRVALGHDDDVVPSAWRVLDRGALASAFATTALATASIAAATLEVAAWVNQRHGQDETAMVTVDTRLASLWFRQSIRPLGWTVPPAWDAVAGDYRAREGGWIRLHTNAPHHRAAALRVLGLGDHEAGHADRDRVAALVAGWHADALEQAVVDAGGCAATMRGLDAWREHPQGRAVNREALVAWEHTPEASGSSPYPAPSADPQRPLAGVRVLDLTRVLAGPVGTRFLAGYGAQVLRLDPLDWNEASLEPEVTLGKRCAGLDLKSKDGRDAFKSLLSHADVLVHGYRADALAALGFDAAARRALRPGLVDVSLNAYGATGPWSQRRGFDSLVQMACGIAHHGRTVAGGERPVPLPVQALDHATGYLMAAAVVQGLRRRARTGEGCTARLSLARTAALLTPTARDRIEGTDLQARDDDFAADQEASAWGPMQRLRPAQTLAGVPHRWALPAAMLRSHPPAWGGG